jgi:hypothetical protein
VTKRERWLADSVDAAATDERELEVRGIAEQLTIRARQHAHEPVRGRLRVTTYSAASSTTRAAGAAVAPPEPARTSITATASSGLAAGA